MKETLYFSLAQAVSSASVPITLAVSAIIGLFLYVMGRKLVKVAIGLSGLCIGAFAAFIGANQLGVSSQLMLVWVIGGAIAGVLLASLLFRFWMSVSLAGLIALAVPAFSVIWQGTPAPVAIDVSSNTPSSSFTQPKATDPESETKDGAITEKKHPIELPVNHFSAEDAKKKAKEIRDSIGIKDDDIEKAKQTVMDALQQAYEYQTARLGGWWESLNSEGQRNMWITTAIAGLCGALLGFILPYFAASIQTSLVGGAVLLSTVHGVLAAYAPARLGWLPNEPRPLLITLSLITLVGIGIQWTLWRKTADK